MRTMVALTIALGAGAATGAAGLSERETSHDRLIVVHYPSDFLKFFVGESINLAGPKGASQWSDMFFVVESRPPSEDLNQLIQKDTACADEPSITVTERSQRPASCFGGLPGLEQSCVYTKTAKPDNPLFLRECMFVKNHHQFTFGYTIPMTERAEVEPLLRSVLAATEAN